MITKHEPEVLKLELGSHDRSEVRFIVGHTFDKALAALEALFALSGAADKPRRKRRTKAELKAAQPQQEAA